MFWILALGCFEIWLLDFGGDKTRGAKAVHVLDAYVCRI